MQYLWDKYNTCFPSITRFWFFIFPWFVIYDPEYTQKVLASSKHNQKPFYYNFLRLFLGYGLLTISGKEWIDHRKILHAAFQTRYLENFIGVFQENAEKLARMFEMDGGGTNITKYVNDCIFNALCSE